MKRSALQANLNLKQLDPGICHKSKPVPNTSKAPGIFDRRRVSEATNLNLLLMHEAKTLDFSKRQSLLLVGKRKGSTSQQKKQFSRVDPSQIVKSPSTKLLGSKKKHKPMSSKRQVENSSGLKTEKKSHKKQLEVTANCKSPKRMFSPMHASRPSILAHLWRPVSPNLPRIPFSPSRLDSKNLWSASTLVMNPAPARTSFGQPGGLLSKGPAQQPTKSSGGTLQRSKSLTVLIPWNPPASLTGVRTPQQPPVGLTKGPNKRVLEHQGKDRLQDKHTQVSSPTASISIHSNFRRKRVPSLDVPKRKQLKGLEPKHTVRPAVSAKPPSANLGSAQLEQIDPSSPKGKKHTLLFDVEGRQADEQSPSEDRHSLVHASGSLLGSGEPKRKHKILTKYTDFSEGSEDIHKTREKRVPWINDESNLDARGLDSTPHGNFLLYPEEYGTFDGDEFYKITPEEEEKMRLLGMQRKPPVTPKPVVHEVIKLPFTGSQEKWT